MSIASYWMILALTLTGLTNRELDSNAPIISKAHALNTQAKEVGVCCYPDGQSIVISSYGHPRKYSFDEPEAEDTDLFVTNRYNNTEQWQEPRVIDFVEDINTLGVDQGEPFISRTGSLFTFQHWDINWEESRFIYFEVEIANNRIDIKTKPKGVNKAITSFMIQKNFLATDGMTRALDGSFIFAAGASIDAPMNLYYSEYLGDGQYAKPKKLDCNSSGDDRSPTLSNDGQILYFSSNRSGTGEKTTGGMDIFLTSFHKGNTGPVLNLGSPVNTNKDESGFTWCGQQEKEAYFIRDGDVYQAKYPNGNPYQIPKTPTPRIGPVNVVLVIDASTEMNSREMTPLFIKELSTLLPIVHSKSRISVLTFNATGYNQYCWNDAFTPMAVKSTLEQVVYNGRQSNRPPLLESLQLAEEQLSNNRKNMVILLTNGAIDRSFASPIVRNFTSNTPLMILSVGNPSEMNQERLAILASQGSGKYYNINSSNIKTILRKLFSKD